MKKRKKRKKTMKKRKKRRKNKWTTNLILPRYGFVSIYRD